MTVKGHLLLANNLLLFLIPKVIPIFDNYSYLHLIIFYNFFIFGVVFVDIDEPNSYIGRKLFFISYPFKILNLAIIFIISLFTKNKSLKRIFEHRGFTHMFIFPLIIFFIGSFFQGSINICIIFFAFGVFTHQLGDLITNTGIRNYLFPIPIDNVKSFITFNTGSYVEILINIFLIIILMFQIIYILKDFIK